MKSNLWKVSPMLLAAVTGSTITGCQNTGAKESKTPVKSRPNVVIIVADDLGMGDVSCYGSKTISTPNIDALSRDGLRLDNGYATSATSSPSRFALFTGIYPFRADMHILPGDSPLMIPVDAPTMPKMFQKCGYTTGAVGKWHLGMGDGHTDWNKPIVPSANTVGFDFTNLIPATVDRVPTVYVENGQVLGLDPKDPLEVNYDENFPGEPTALTNPEMMTMPWHHGHQGTIVDGIPRIGYMKGGHSARWKDDQMADYFLGKVKGFIDQNAGKPFFLYYGLHEPHVPRVPGPRFAGATSMGPRGDVIIEADWCVGEVMKYLKSKNLLDNTIVIFTSDNGAVVQDGYMDKSDSLLGAHDPNNGMRGGKYSLFDGGPHVPFIVYWKGHIAPGYTDAVVNQVDLFASFARMLGVQAPDSLDSEDHLDVFLGKKGEQRSASGAKVLSEKRQFKAGRQSMYVEAVQRLALVEPPYVLMPAYKGPKYHRSGNEFGNLDDWELFNLSDDKHQDRNIASEQPERFAKMKAKFLKDMGKYYNPAGQDFSTTSK